MGYCIKSIACDKIYIVAFSGNGLVNTKADMREEIWIWKGYGIRGNMQKLMKIRNFIV